MVIYSCLLFSLCSSIGLSAQTPTIKVLVGFPCVNGTDVCPDGSGPEALVQASDGNFYGTTTSSGGSSAANGGTVFKISSTGQFTLLKIFGPNPSGQFSSGNDPVGSLVEGNDGFLYGATRSGGSQNAGVIFKISKSGTFKVLHNFCSAAGCADGIDPIPLMLGNDGNLYGGTLAGGTSNNGTIFRITPIGALTTLHSLNDTTDGGPPSTALLQASDGNFYGVGFISPNGALGNLFRVTPQGQFTDIHNMGTPPDADANARLIQASNGLLYGTTFYGEVFQISLTGLFKIVVPGTFSRIQGGVAQVSDGNLWGTHAPTFDPNEGDLFEVSTSGSQLLEIPFDCSTIGGDPQGIIQGADGKLYGVNVTCGIDTTGHPASGTVFVVDAGLAAPKADIAALSLMTGTAGSIVTIRGDHFVGATSVTFNGVAAQFKVLNTKFITTTVPTGATTGPIVVTNAGGTTSSQSFTVK